LRGGNTKDILLGAGTGAISGYTSSSGLPAPINQLISTGANYLVNKETNKATQPVSNISGGGGGTTFQPYAQSENRPSRSLLEVIDSIKSPEMYGLTNKDGMLMSELYGQQKAAGGMIHGPGGPKDDMIPARLSDGEYVIQASAVEKLGKNLLDYLNSLGDK
jgi:hypothetical protein